MRKILIITMGEDYPFSVPRPNEQTHNGSILIRKVIRTN